MSHKRVQPEMSETNWWWRIKQEKQSVKHKRAKPEFNWNQMTMEEQCKKTNVATYDIIKIGVPYKSHYRMFRKMLPPISNNKCSRTDKRDQKANTMHFLYGFWISGLILQRLNWNGWSMEREGRTWMQGWREDICETGSS